MNPLHHAERRSGPIRAILGESSEPENRRRSHESPEEHEPTHKTCARAVRRQFTRRVKNVRPEERRGMWIQPDLRNTQGATTDEQQDASMEKFHAAIIATKACPIRVDPWLKIGIRIQSGVLRWFQMRLP